MPPPSNEQEALEQVIRELGLDPAIIEGFGPVTDPYAIFTGWLPGGLTGAERVPDRKNLAPPPRPYERRPGPPIDARDVDPRARPAEQPVYATDTTVGELLQRFYKFHPQTLRQIQALLYAGGFYGNIDIDQIRWGEHDEASFAAWTTAVARAARITAAGRDISVNDLLNEVAKAAGLDMNALAEAIESGDDDAIEALLERLVGGEEEGRVINVILSDPNGLRATIDRVASSVLGRKANAAEQRMFISFIHELQRQGQIAMATAEADTVEVGTEPMSAVGVDDSPLRPGDVVTEYAPPDEAATAEALLRRENPEEAAAHDIAVQVANLLDMLPAPVHVPRVTF